MIVVMFIGGLVLLYCGAELLVRHASLLALLMRIPSLIIGLTVVAFGTSFPELMVSVRAAFEGNTGIALGNVVGSNIFNVLFILGLSAVIAPLVVSQKLIRFDVPVMIGASAAVFIMGLDYSIGRIDGMLLFASLFGYTFWLYRKVVGTANGSAGENAEGKPVRKIWVDILIHIIFIICGLIILVIGSKWLVAGATAIAHKFGLSQLVIGLTIVSAGTSLPEAATSIVAAVRKERDIAVGNIVGSNIFNIFCVLGLSSALVSGGIRIEPAALHFDIPVMIAVAVACLPIFFSGYAIERWEGLLFFVYYGAYILYLFLSSFHSAAFASYKIVMVTFVIPLTIVTVIISLVRKREDSITQRPACL